MSNQQKSEAELLVEKVRESNAILKSYDDNKRADEATLNKETDAAVKAFDNALASWTPERSCLSEGDDGKLYLTIPVSKDYLEVSVGDESKGTKLAMQVPLKAFAAEGLEYLLRYSQRKFADACNGKTSDATLRAKRMHTSLAKILSGDLSGSRSTSLQSAIRALVEKSLSDADKKELKKAKDENKSDAFLDEAFDNLPEKKQKATLKSAEAIVELKKRQAQEKAELLASLLGDETEADGD